MYEYPASRIISRFHDLELELGWGVRFDNEFSQIFLE
jgi:hypothetical protein